MQGTHIWIGELVRWRRSGFGCIECAADARAQRLARFGGGGNGNVEATDVADEINAAVAEKKEEKKEVPDEDMKDAAPTPAAAEKPEEDTKMDVDEPE